MSPVRLTKVPGQIVGVTQNRVLVDPVSEQLRQLKDIEHLGWDDDGLRRALLDGLQFDARIENLVTGAEIERTMEGASTVTITIFDSEGALLAGQGITTRGGGFAQGGPSFLSQSSPLVRLTLDGYEYELVKVQKQGRNITLTLEDYLVALMRRYNKPRKAYRDKVTRAQFAHSLVREVRERRIGFVSPNEARKQPIAGSGAGRVTQRQAARDEAARAPGFADNADIRVKGAKTTSSQKKLLALAMRICDEKNASFGVRAALICGMTQESNVSNDKTPDQYGSVGVLQAQLRYHGDKAYDPEYQIRVMLDKGFTGWHGYEGLIASVQKKRCDHPVYCLIRHLGPASWTYQYYYKWWDEAKKTVRLWTGDASATSSSDADTGNASETVVKRYAFTRGTSSKKEDTWTCLGRLADEVNWRRFLIGDTLYFISETDLLAAKPNLTVSEDSPGVDEINFDFDYGKKAQAATIQARAGMWTVPPGLTVELEDLGPANGRWLVSAVRRSLFSAATEITLKRPTPQKPEPAPETETRTTSDSGGSGSSSSQANGDAEKVVEFLKGAVGVREYSSTWRKWMSKVGGYDPWCGFFVEYVLQNVAGIAGSYDLGAVDHARNLIRSGSNPFLKEVSRAERKPGDVLVWNGHIGFYIGGNEAVSGNWSDGVGRHDWDNPPGKYLTAIGRPRYKE